MNGGFAGIGLLLLLITSYWQKLLDYLQKGLKSLGKNYSGEAARYIVRHG